MGIVLGLTALVVFLHRPVTGRRRGRPLLKSSGSHWRRMYSRRSFLRLGGALLGAGALAYSGTDAACDQWYKEHVRSQSSDRLAKLAEPWGRRFWFLNWLLLATLDATYHSSSFTRWGRRNLEAMLVGLPTLWSLQYGLGGSRPTDETWGPRWHPFADDNTASGHAFMAAIPWLNAARAAGGKSGRALARLGSLLTAWSRFNDRKHYLSQVLLGYGIAWNAVESVADAPARRPAAGDETSEPS